MAQEVSKAHEMQVFLFMLVLQEATQACRNLLDAAVGRNNWASVVFAVIQLTRPNGPSQKLLLEAGSMCPGVQTEILQPPPIVLAS